MFWELIGASHKILRYFFGSLIFKHGNFGKFTQGISILLCFYAHYELRILKCSQFYGSLHMYKYVFNINRLVKP